jgi:pimeloyl-ACP methyl ester carboxylesterase
MAVRYDKRGFGQSGGRAESATLLDYAEDVRTVVRWVAARKDVDRQRIAVIGHSEGAWVGMLAAAREGRIAALVTLAGAGSPGADLILEQQQAALAQSQVPAPEREARVALQKQIHAAVLTGKGWEGVPLPLRRQADTPWFQSVLNFDPAKTIKGVRQPILIVHGALDKQVPIAHAERLADLARSKGSKSKAVELVVVRGVNHLLAPAVTGEVAEYTLLPDRNVSADVSTAVTTWLAKTFQAVR